VRRDQTVRHGQPSHQWQPELQERCPGLARDGEEDRRQQYEADSEEDRQADDEGDEQHRPWQAPWAQRTDERVCHDLRAAGFGQEFTQDGTESDDHGDVGEHLANALLKLSGDVWQIHA